MEFPNETVLDNRIQCEMAILLKLTTNSGVSVYFIRNNCGNFRVRARILASPQNVKHAIYSFSEKLLSLHSLIAITHTLDWIQFSVSLNCEYVNVMPKLCYVLGLIFHLNVYIFCFIIICCWRFHGDFRGDCDNCNFRILI